MRGIAKIGTFVICLMLFFGILGLVQRNETAKATSLQNGPTDNTDGTNPLTDPTNAYTSDDSYATVPIPNTVNTTYYHGFGFQDLGTVISDIEVGVEWYTSQSPNDNIFIFLSVDGGTIWFGETLYTSKIADDDTLEYSSFASERAWDWDDLSDTNLRVIVRIQAGVGGGDGNLDYIVVRVTHGTEGNFKIVIIEPSHASIIKETIDLIAVAEANGVIEDVRFTINGNEYFAIHDQDTDTYQHKDFNTKFLITGTWYELTATLNLTDGRSTSHTISVYVDNHKQGCWQDDDGRWHCPKGGKTYPGIITRGSSDETLVDPYWYVDYFVESSSSGLSSNHPDTRLNVADNCKEDEFHLSNYDYSLRSWINTTSGILQNTTYASFFDGGGCVEIYVNSSVSIKSDRDSHVRHNSPFNWTYDEVSKYDYTVTISNTLSYTMNDIFFYVGADPDSIIDETTTLVMDVTNNNILVPGEDFGQEDTGFHMQIDSIASSGSRTFSFEYHHETEGSSVVPPVITITPSEVTKTDRNKVDYMLGEDNIRNKNPFDYDGVVNVHFDLDRIVSKTSKIYIEDDNGKSYPEFQWITETQLQIIGVAVDANGELAINIWFKYKAEITEDPVNWIKQFSLGWFVGWFILSAISGSYIWRTKGLSYEGPEGRKLERARTVAWLLLLLGIFMIAFLVVLGSWVS